jgi:hypothetical protein
VPSVTLARRELELQPITDAFAAFVRAVKAGEPAAPLLATFCERAGITEHEPITQTYTRVATAPARLAKLGAEPALALASLCTPETARLAPVLAVLRALPVGAANDWWLWKVIAENFGPPEQGELLPLVFKPRSDREVVEAGRAFLQVNRYQEVDWFNAERMTLLVEGQGLSRLVGLLADAAAGSREVLAAQAAQAKLKEAVAASAYKLAVLLESLPAPAVPKPPTSPVAPKPPNAPAPKTVEKKV